MAELLALLEDANRQLSLGIALAGPGAERMQACFEEALTARGYEVQSNVDEQATSVDIEGSYDVLIKGQVRAEERGRIRGSEVVDVRLTVRLINGKNDRILKTISGSQKGTRRSVDAAISTAAVQLCRKKVPGMIRDIDRYFVASPDETCIAACAAASPIPSPRRSPLRRGGRNAQRPTPGTR